MSKVGFNRVLVTKGDFGFATGGLDLYTIKVTGKGNKTRKVFNNAIKVKQPVLWVTPNNNAVPQTIEPAALTVGDLGKLHLGVAHSSKGNGIVDSIREVGAGELGGCSIDKLGAYGPTCPLGEIKAIYPTCLSCDGLSIKVTLDDNVTRGFNALRKVDERVFNYTPQCKDCENCDRTPSGDEFMCGLVDAVNGDLQSIEVDGLPYPGIQARDFDKPYRAVKLHANFDSFCIVPTDGTCVECDRITALTTFTVNDVVYNFEGVSDPADNTKTLTSQLEEAARQIEDAFQAEYGKHGGWVTLTKGIGNCCGIQLYVSTCDPNFAIAGLSACGDAIVPFPTFTTSSFCEDCTSTDTTDTPTFGMAVIAKQDELDCSCYPGQVPEYTGRHITIDVFDHDDVISTNYKKATLQKGQLAANYGTQVQQREYRQLVGGDGFDFSEGNTYSGYLGLPDKNSKIEHMITAECPTSYCTYYVQGLLYSDTFVRPEKRVFQHFSEVNVPQKDTTTTAAMEALFTKLAALDPQVCDSISAATCA